MAGLETDSFPKGMFSDCCVEKSRGSPVSSRPLAELGNLWMILAAMRAVIESFHKPPCSSCPATILSAQSEEVRCPGVVQGCDRPAWIQALIASRLFELLSESVNVHSAWLRAPMRTLCGEEPPAVVFNAFPVPRRWSLKRTGHRAPPVVFNKAAFSQARRVGLHPRLLMHVRHG